VIFAAAAAPTNTVPASTTPVATPIVPEHAAVAAVWLDARDDVATALRAIAAGERVRVQCGEHTCETVARDPIPLGHKLALRALEQGTRVRKYGEFIGRLTADVAEGDWIHTHNLATAARRTTAEEMAWRGQALPPGGTRHAVRNVAAIPATSRDGRTRYVPQRTHGYVHAQSLSTGARAVFADLGGLPGEPVAVAVDAEDHVWVALWDAGALLRYAPDGALVRVLRLPTSRPVTLAFDPAGTHDLYVATSREGLAPARLAAEPDAGSTLVLDAGVSGNVGAALR